MNSSRPAGHTWHVPVHDIDGARRALRAGTPEELLGVAECGWLDVKSGVYQLDDPVKADELAKDVAAFANARTNGLLLVGFSTRREHDVEIIDDMHPVPRHAIDLDRHRKLIRERVIPAPMNVHVDWIDCGNGKGILQIDVPPQPPTRLPHVVAGTSRAGTGSRASVAVPIRDGDAIAWATQAEVQGWLSAGWPAAGRPGGEFRRTLTGQMVWLAEDFPPSAAGVHRAITELDDTGGDLGTLRSSARGEWRALPPYVPRDHDVLLRGRLAAAAARSGGLVLVTGRSCTGKTRSLWEAVRADEFRGWHVVRPRDAGQLRSLSADGALQPNSFVWLDEMQNFFSPDSQGLTADDLRALWMRQARVVAVASLWPEIYDEMRRPVTWPAGGAAGQAHQVLELADGPVRVPDRVEGAELDRAWEAAADSEQIRRVLGDPDHGMTQVLAGAPWLVQRWEQPRFPYTRSVLAAAAAAWRAGARSPLSAGFLQDAARAYFPDRRSAPAGWFARGMEEATELIRGAVSALVPVRGPSDDDRPAGYILTDYLAQHTREGRGVEPIPEKVWHALAAEAAGSGDLPDIADNARSRMLYRLAEQFCRLALAAGHDDAHDELSAMVTDQGRYGEAIGHERGAVPAESRPARAASRLKRAAALLNDLRMIAESDDDAHRDMVALARNLSAQHLRDVIEGPPSLDKLWTLASEERDEGLSTLREFAGSSQEAREALRILFEHGRAEKVRAMTGDSLVLRGLALLLHDNGRTEEAIAFLRESGPDDDRFQHCSRALAILLADSGRIDEAVDELRQAYAAERLILRTEEMLVSLLAKHGRRDMIRRMADEGFQVAGWAHARLLAAEGQIEKACGALEYLAVHGYVPAGRDLGLLLADHGQVEEASKLLTGPEFDHDADYRSLMAAALADKDRIDDLRRVAAFPPARPFLSALLAFHRSPGELGKAAASGDAASREALAILAVMGYLAHADAFRRFGLNPDGSIPLDGDNTRAVMPATAEKPEKDRLLAFICLSGYYLQW